MSNKIITLEHLQTNNEEMKKWVGLKLTNASNYLGVVNSGSGLWDLAQNQDIKEGDYCRASQEFILGANTGIKEELQEVVHVGDLIIAKRSNTAGTAMDPDYTSWDIIHTEDTSNYVTTDTSQTITGAKFISNTATSHQGPIEGISLMGHDIYVSATDLNMNSEGNYAHITPGSMGVHAGMYSSRLGVGKIYNNNADLLLPNVSGTLATQEWVGKRFLGTITKEDDFTNIVEEKNAKTGDYVIVETEFFGGPPVGGTNLPVGSIIIYSEDGSPTVIKSNDLLSENNTWTGTNNWTGESSFNAVLEIKDFINPSTHIEFYANGDIIKRDIINNIPSEFRIHFPTESGTLATQNWVKAQGYDAAPATYTPDSKIENAVIFENVKTKLKIGHLYKIIANNKASGMNDADFRTTFDFIYSGNDTGIVDKIPQVFTYMDPIFDPSNNSINKTFYPNGLIWVEFVTGENGSNNQRLYVKFNLGDRVVVPMAIDVELVEVR